MTIKSNVLNDPKLRNKLKRVPCHKTVISLAALERNDAAELVLLLDAWIDFHQAAHLVKYETEFRVYRIEDGETHWVAARSADEANAMHCRDTIGQEVSEWMEEYQPQTDELAPDIAMVITDEDGNIDIKSNAERCLVDAPTFIGSTADY